MQDRRNDSLLSIIVDRSGSMSGDPIMTTVETLKLFVQSLPAGCMFDIISFGSSF